MKKEKYNKDFILFNNFFQSFLKKKREQIFYKISKHVPLKKKFKKLDVGTSPCLDEDENIFLNKLKGINITIISNQDCSVLKKKFKKLKIIKKNALMIDRKFKKYEIVHSNATIEHVGNFKNQIKFIKNLYLISKKYLIITTPNRYHPFELHTKLFFLHWLPQKKYRYILKFFGENFYSKESNLNLLDENKIIIIMKKLDIKNYKIKKIKFLGFISNLILIIKKD